MTTPNDSRDFYPTPDDLAWKMVHGLYSNCYGWKHLPQPILEPSAGDGALARAIHSAADIRHDSKTGKIDRYDESKAKEFDLDCIELSSDFRAKLKKDGFRVVHDDFLTFRPCKKYAAVVMNPPFSTGAAHLLKALDVMKDGGKICCLLNAETIRNPYTNERKELVQKLDELKAEIEYIPDAFKNAARTSRVEIALIRVEIPDKEPVSKIRLELHNETTARMKSDPRLAALVSADPITAAVERYNAAAEGIRRIYEEYQVPFLDQGLCTASQASCLSGSTRGFQKAFGLDGLPALRKVLLAQVRPFRRPHILHGFSWCMLLTPPPRWVSMPPFDHAMNSSQQ